MENKYTKEDLINFAKWFNENQFRGVKGDITKALFIKCNYPAIVDKAIEKLNLDKK